MKEKKRKGGQVALGDALKNFMKTSGINQTAGEGATFSAWNAAAEALLGAQAPAVRFQNGELVAEANSSAQLQELKGFLGEELRQEANRRLGGEKISKVVFRIGTPS